MATQVIPMNFMIFDLKKKQKNNLFNFSPILKWIAANCSGEQSDLRRGAEQEEHEAKHRNSKQIHKI